MIALAESSARPPATQPIMPLLRRFLSRVSEDVLLLVLLVALVPLLWLMPEQLASLHRLVDWKTIGALTGLLVLSRGLEDSGYLARAGSKLLARIHGERTLAAMLVLFSVALAAVVTNDVALFIVVPLTLSLRTVAALPVGRLVIFEAMAVNAGSTLSPVGNPQNLFLWQSSPLGFAEFTWMMLPLGVGMTVLVLAAVPLGFSAARIRLSEPRLEHAGLDRDLFRLSLACYPAFLILADLGHAPIAALALLVLYALFHRRVLRGVDWLLLGVFVLMFVDLGLLARLPVLREAAAGIENFPGGVFAAAVVLSQFISNVPATIFLSGFTDDVRALAWGVSVGGFGIAIGSLANLIALRLARQPGLWREFHYWSLPALLLCAAVAAWLRPTAA